MSARPGDQPRAAEDTPVQGGTRAVRDQRVHWSASVWYNLDVMGRRKSSTMFIDRSFTSSIYRNFQFEPKDFSEKMDEIWTDPNSKTQHEE